MARLWTTLFILSLVVAFYLRIQTLDEPYTIEYDTEGMMKNAREIVEFGHLPAKEPLRYAGYFPDGWDNREVLPLTPYAIALLSFGQPNLVRQASMWYPVIFGMLSIVVFGLIGEELFGEPGLVAGALLGVVPGYLFRTMAGFCDKEPLAMFLCGLGIYFFVKAFKERKHWLSLLSGISFGIALFAWGGYHVYILPLGLFSVLMAFFDDDRGIVFIPVLAFFPFVMLQSGLFFFESYYGLVILACGLFLLVNEFVSDGVVDSLMGRLFIDFVGRFRPYERALGLSISRKALISLIILVLVGMIGLYVLGRDPLFVLVSFIRYIQDPVRGGVHARSVAEQIVPDWGVWGRELNNLRLVFPFTYVVDPTVSLLTLVLASIPISLLLAWTNKFEWEYVFVSVGAFMANFVAASSVRMFFPMMPMTCLAGASVFAYIMNRDEKLWKQIGSLLACSMIVTLIPISLDNTKYIGASMDFNWFESLKWYKYNSKESSPLATWWDYGYWIYNVADRPSLADGSNAYYPPDVDLGKLLTEPDESVARDYLISKGTRAVLVDNSMMGKMYWISSIGRGEENGTNYGVFSYRGVSNTTRGMVRSYQDEGGFQVLVTEKEVLVGRDGRYALIELVASPDGYFSQIKNYTEPHVSGSVVLSQDIAILVPPSLVDALYTRMFFLDGVGFKWLSESFDNGEIKIFNLK